MAKIVKTMKTIAIVMFVSFITVVLIGGTFAIFGSPIRIDRMFHQPRMTDQQCELLYNLMQSVIDEREQCLTAVRTANDTKWQDINTIIVYKNSHQSKINKTNELIQDCKMSFSDEPEFLRLLSQFEYAVNRLYEYTESSLEYFEKMQTGDTDTKNDNLYQGVKNFSYRFNNEHKATDYFVNMVKSLNCSVDIKYGSTWGLDYKDIKVNGRIVDYITIIKEYNAL